MFEQLFGKNGVGGPLDRPFAPDEVWRDPATEIAFDLGIGHMRENLLRELMSGGSGRIQVETMMTAVGALAGFAVQHAIRETIVKSGRLPEHGGRDASAGAFVVVSLKDGSRWFFGDLINAYLVPMGKEAVPLGPGNCTLWNLVSGVVQHAGGEPLGFDEITRMMKRSAEALGTPAFGVPEVPDKHRPLASARQTLDAWWGMTREVLTFEAAPPLAGKPLTPGLWPTVLALTAQTMMLMTKDTLDPAMSMRLLFEAAIPMSKVDPATVPGPR